MSLGWSGMTEFIGFPKVPRLNRPIVITEKIDGTNGCVVIEEVPYEASPDQPEDVQSVVVGEGNSSPFENPSAEYWVYAQSRKRVITPKEDNHGFASWVWDNAAELVMVLGPGRHFGEWWGSGVNRGYGLKNGEKRFSLFNTRRWDVQSEASDDDPLGVLDDWTKVPGLRVVPTLAEYETFNTQDIEMVADWLRRNGSVASPGFDRPEGIVIYHRASNGLFKVTLENDQEPKGLSKNRVEETHAPIPKDVIREAMETRAALA